MTLKQGAWVRFSKITDKLQKSDKVLVAVCLKLQFLNMSNGPMDVALWWRQLDDASSSTVLEYLYKSDVLVLEFFLFRLLHFYYISVTL